MVCLTLFGDSMKLEAVIHGSDVEELIGIVQTKLSTESIRKSAQVKIVNSHTIRVTFNDDDTSLVETVIAILEDDYAAQIKIIN